MMMYDTGEGATEAVVAGGFKFGSVDTMTSTRRLRRFWWRRKGAESLNGG